MFVVFFFLWRVFPVTQCYYVIFRTGPKKKKTRNVNVVTVVCAYHPFTVSLWLLLHTQVLLTLDHSWWPLVGNVTLTIIHYQRRQQLVCTRLECLTQHNTCRTPMFISAKKGFCCSKFIEMCVLLNISKRKVSHYLLCDKRRPMPHTIIGWGD